MTPLHYIIEPIELQSALTAGARWVQLNGTFDKDTVETCHAAGCFAVVTDNVELCRAAGADGVMLTADGVRAIGVSAPQPTGIVLQRPLPITTAIAATRAVLGEDSLLLLGVEAECPDDAIAAAKAGADYIHVPLDACVESLRAVRNRSFTTPVVAVGCIDPDAIPQLLDEGVSGFACTASDVPPVLLPALLSADEM